MFTNKVSLKDALADLQQCPELFKTYFTHGSLELELYQPKELDHQQPHDRDEVYIVSSGTAEFEIEGEFTKVETGDFLFVPARLDHRFHNFSEDFSTWVLFYGPKEGEQGTVQNHL